MKLDMADIHQKNLHHLLMGIVVPRPIAWVSTIGEDGVFNLAPYSAYCVVSARPAMVGFCVAGTMDGQKKDTLRNIESTREFVINVVNETLAEQMNMTSAPYTSDVDEFKEAGLTAVEADLVKAPMVAESPVNIENIFCPDNTPVSNRADVPEFPQFRILEDSFSPDLPTPSMVSDPWTSFMLTPSCFMIRLAERTSAPVESPNKLDLPQPNELNIKIRCEMDLSPGI